MAGKNTDPGSPFIMICGDMGYIRHTEAQESVTTLHHYKESHAGPRVLMLLLLFLDIAR